MRTTEEILDAAGARLRDVRTRRGMTIVEVSKITGISESTLSRLEKGQRRATLELLLPLSVTYRVPLDSLVGAPYTGDPTVHIRPVQRDGLIYMSLTSRPGGLQAHKLIIPPSADTAEPEPQTHAGYEWIYVLNGTLHLILGDSDLTLQPGEVAEFDTHIPHWLGAAGGAPVELLVLFGRQGERAHLRARTGKRA